MTGLDFKKQDEYIEELKKHIPMSFMFGGNDSNSMFSHSSMNGDYTNENLIEWFENPDKYKKEIIKASRYLYASNGLYKLMINYHSNLINLDYNLIPDFTIQAFNGEIDEKVKKDAESIFKSKEKTNLYIKGIMEKSNIRKIIKAVLKEGVYFGYEEQNSNKKYFFQTLDRDYCKIFAFADGMPTFKFNFKYFDDFGEDLLDFYPPEFRTLYNKYVNGDDEWQQIDPTSSICILMDEDDHSLPAFSGMFSDLLDMNDFYTYLKRNTNFETLRLLIQKGLINEKTGDPLTSPELLRMYNQMLQRAFGDDVIVASTIFDIEPIDFSKGGANNDNDLGVNLTKEKTLMGAGISKAITGESENATAVKFNDANSTKLVMSIVEKIERWINNRVYKLASPKKYPWKVEILPTTLNNSGEIHKAFKEMFTYGGSLRYALSSLGVDQDDYINSLHLEYLEGLIEMLTPPSSTHTTSGDDNVGRPTSDDGEISDEGVQTRDTDGNER